MKRSSLFLTLFFVAALVFSTHLSAQRRGGGGGGYHGGGGHATRSTANSSINRNNNVNHNTNVNRNYNSNVNVNRNVNVNVNNSYHGGGYYGGGCCYHPVAVAAAVTATAVVTAAVVGSIVNSPRIRVRHDHRQRTRLPTMRQYLVSAPNGRHHNHLCCGQCTEMTKPNLQT
jgi:hypothetical protein